VIVVQDLPDPAGARAAIDAGASGRMLLAGLNADGCAEAIELLLEMGLSAWSLSSVLLGVVAQRTVRRLCPECRQPVEFPKDLAQILSCQDDARLVACAPAGCPSCGHTGYSGRLAIFALLAIDQGIRRMLRNGSREDTAQALARQCLGAYRRSALDLLRDGVVSPEEVLRALR